MTENLPERLDFDIPAIGGFAAHRIACTRWGDPASERTVFCGHGLTRNGRDFDFLARALVDRGFCIICPDMPGRGDSEYLTDPKGYVYPAYVGDVLFLLHELELTRVDWVGTSMGGIMGMMAANIAPGLIRSLVLNDIGCIVASEGLKRIVSYAGSPTRYATREQAQAALRERCAPFGIRDEKIWQHLFTYGLKTNADGTTSFACDPAIGASLPAANEVIDIDLWKLWEPVKAFPVLLLRGAESDLLRKETALEMQSRHPHLTFHEIAGCGHAPSLMEDGQIALVLDWIQKQ